MDFMTVFDDCISFAKDKIDEVTKFWKGLDDDKKKLIIGCAVGCVALICVASVAYAIGKASGKRLAYDEEDF